MKSWKKYILLELVVAIGSICVLVYAKSPWYVYLTLVIVGWVYQFLGLLKSNVK